MLSTSRSFRWLPWLAAIAFFMQTLDATIINTAIPALAEALHQSPLAMQSTVISYSLTVALLIPVSGWLADRFGTRRVFMLALGLFTLGSLACAISHTLFEMVVARILQGIGGAMMVPVARLALLRSYPRGDLLRVLNLATMPGLIGPVVGPMLGGILVTYASWQWIFLINLPVGFLGLWFAWHIMPDLRHTTAKFDWLGFVLFGGALVLFMGGIESFGKPFLGVWAAIGLIIGAVCLMGCYIWLARTHRAPLIRLSLFDTRTFAIGIRGNVCARLGSGCVPFLVPLLLQVGFGFSALYAGLMMAPLALGSLLGKSFVTGVLRRLGYRQTLTGVTLLIGGLIAVIALISSQSLGWLLLMILVVLGLARSIQFTAMNTITLGDLSKEETSAGNSVLSVTQQLSISFGVAISAAFLQFYTHMVSQTVINHFQLVFLTMGGFTMLAAASFLWLRPNDGQELIPVRSGNS